MPRNIAPAVYNFDEQAGCVVRGKNRMTGSIIGLYQATQAGLDDSKGNWVVKCDTHGPMLSFTSALHAKMSISDPTEWCAECKEAMKNRKPPRIRSYQKAR